MKGGGGLCAVSSRPQLSSWAREIGLQIRLYKPCSKHLYTAVGKEGESEREKEWERERQCNKLALSFCWQKLLCGLVPDRPCSPADQCKSPYQKKDSIGVRFICYFFLCHTNWFFYILSHANDHTFVWILWFHQFCVFRGLKWEQEHNKYQKVKCQWQIQGGSSGSAESPFLPFCVRTSPAARTSTVKNVLDSGTPFSKS